MAKKNLFYLPIIVAAILMIVGFTGGRSAWAALAGLGPPVEPHGFPAYYEDAKGLALEPCLPPPAGNATLGNGGLCLFDPLAGPPLEVGGESFWWMAEAKAPPLIAGGKSLLVLALEAAFGGAEVPIDGQQMTFGRVRIRIDVPAAGTYTVTHPYGTQVFENVTVAEGINYTADIGAVSILDPALGFNGALSSPIGPFLTWPDYQQEPGLQLRALDPATGAPTGAVLEQYVGNPGVPHVVTGGPNGNIFRIEGPAGIDVSTDLFSVMGKVYDPTVITTAHIFPDAPLPNLFALGPINRAAPFAIPTTGVVTGTEFLGYPLGYPLWYQDTVLVTDPVTGDPVLDPVTGEQVRAGGLQLTFCPSLDPMCISAPIDQADPNSVALRMGEEGFFWTAEAFIDEGTTDLAGDLPAGLEGLLVMALEGAFGGAGAPLDGQQIAFARLRIRIDTPAAGTYRVTHPYGEEVFENVLADRRAINETIDIMIINSADPDGAFVGALYGMIGPRFLTWDTFNADPLLNDPALQEPFDLTDPLSPVVQYVGNPLIPHVVTGSPTGNNFFSIRGPDGIDVQTSLFTVAGKVFAEGTFNVLPNPNAPIANADSVLLDLAQAPATTIDVLGNDAFLAPATVVLAVGPANGTATVNADGTVTYTPDAGFGGADTFAYQITDSTGLTSASATVTVTVTPVETIAITRARFSLRRLQLDIRGTGNFEGTSITIHAGGIDGPVIGQALVSRGRWQFRGTATANVTAVSIVSSTGLSLTDQPLQVR